MTPAEQLVAPVADLVAALPVGVVVTDPAQTEKYRNDHFVDPGAGTLLAAVRAESTQQVQQTLRWASQHAVAVIPRGLGTGLSGGSTAVDGAISLSLERMRRLKIDPSRNIARAEPGVVNAEIKKAAAEHGLWYPPDPSSYEISSIGGNVATNAGGLCCVKYGVTGDYVLGLEVVLVDGRIVRVGGQTRKDTAGLNLRQLFVGSEGTLGVITDITLRLTPRPGPASTLVAVFPDVVSAGRAVVELRRRHDYSMMELMDRAAINGVEDHQPHGLDREAGALLLVQSDSPDASRVAQIADAVKICSEAGATSVIDTDDPDDGELFIGARRSAGLAFGARGPMISEDVCVPVDVLPEALLGIEQVARDHAVEIPVIAHAGDGNIHPTIVLPAEGPEARAQAMAALSAIVDLAIGLGGTITGEHGIGRAKAEFLPRQFDADTMALHRLVKSALDPQGLLNPGALL